MARSSLLHTPAEFKIQTVDVPERVISGYAGIFSNTDLARDVLDPGACYKTLLEKRPSEIDVFIAHEYSSLPVGVPLLIEADQRGIYTKTLIKPGPVGDDLLATAQFLLDHGRSLGMSIGFKTRSARPERGPEGKMRRRLLDIDLKEYSFASSQITANPLALVDGVKQMTMTANNPGYRINPNGDRYEVLDEDDASVVGIYGDLATAEAVLQALIHEYNEEKEEGEECYDGDDRKALTESDDTAGGVVATGGRRRKMKKRADDESSETMTDQKTTWNTSYVNSLPNSAFLYVEPGEDDDEGKRVPRSKRHFPYKGSDGAVDEAHVRNAIGRIPQSDANGLDDAKKNALQARARRLLSNTKTAFDPEWSDGSAPFGLFSLAIQLEDAAEQVAASQGHMRALGVDTKTNQRMQRDMRNRLRQVKADLDNILQWAEHADREEEPKALVDWYRRQLDLTAILTGV